MRKPKWTGVAGLAAVGVIAWIGAAGAQEALPAGGGNSPAAAAEPGGQAAEAGVVKAASRVTQVTVYSDRALVTRRASLQLVAGESRLRFERLPGALDVNSVQVKGKGAGVIRGVGLQYVPPAGAEDEDVRQLLRKKQTLEERLQTIQDTIAEAGKEKTFVEAIAKRLTTASEKSEQGELSPQKWIDMVAFYRRRLAALDQEIRGESVKLPALQEERQQIEQEIQNLNRGLQGGKQQAEVWVDLPEAGELTLDLTYVVPGPRWYPHYDLRADSKGAKLQVAYQAMVSQSTGEDWKQVELTLSTAQPKAGAQHPELQPWRVDVYREPPAVYSRSAAPMMRKASRAQPAPAMAEAPAMEAMGAAAPEADLGVAQAAVENQASAVVFTASGRCTVRSDNQPNRVTVAVLTFPAAFRYSAVPKLVASAFLQAKIKNESNYPLLAGQTSVFLDNAFVANGEVKTIAPGEEFEAFLGVDEGLKVEHKLIRRQEQAEGVFGGRIKALYEYQIKLTSHKAQAHELVLKDQIPLSGQGDIVVELLEPVYHEGDGALKKDNLNMLEWHCQIQPGQTLEFPLKFSVSYPKEMKVQGL